MNIHLQVPSLGIEDAQNKQAVYVDMRTPKEFAHFHIPDAIHVPLFSNAEHAQIGTIYRQEGKEVAKQSGLDLFAKKLPDLYQQYKEIQQQNHGRLLLVYCWRGGMRSKSIVSVMSTLGIPVVQLEGGIRSYRKWIVKGLKEEAEKNKPFIVLDGNTGTRKTDILTRLANKGYPVIDLEGLADHRGSVFGHIGRKPNNQKQFECGLYRKLQELQEAPYYIIEAENPRIGNVHLPDVILRGKENGIWIHIDAPLELRMKAICETYPLDKHYDQFVTAFSVIEQRLPPAIAQEVKIHLEKHDAVHVVERLLEHYYDPRYLHAAKQHTAPAYSLRINSLADGTDKVQRAVDQIIKEHYFGHKIPQTSSSS